MTKSIYKFIFLSSIFIQFTIILEAKDYNITDFGAKSDGKTNSTLSIQKTIDECSITGGKVIFPTGIYATGTIHLKSNVHIVLSTGAIWTAVNDAKAFEFIKPVVASRMDITPWKAFIYAANIENISITGNGTISPRGDYDIFQTHKGNDNNRPYGLHFVNCNNILIEGISLKNSAFWMQRYYRCNYLTIKNIRVFNHCNLNNDGMDIDGCQNVIISDCIIDSADDALCLKSEGNRACKDIVITNCILSSFASAFKMGTGSVGGFQRITAINCVIRPSKSKINHHEFNLWGGISGIDIGNVDGGIMDEINISNFVIDSVETPLFIRLGERFDRDWDKNHKTIAGKSSNINISNITAKASGQITSSITGYPNHRINNIKLSNIQLTARGKGTEKDLSIDVPEKSGGYPVNRMFGVNLPAYGLYIRHAQNISLNQITFCLDNEDSRSAIVLDDVENLKLNNFHAEQNCEKSALVRIINSENILIDGDNEIKDIKNFIKVEGKKSEGIKLQNNFLFDAKEKCTPINLSIEAINESNSIIQLKWDSSSPNDVGLYNYIIYRNSKEIARTNNHEYTDEDIEEAKEYKYEIASVNGYGIISDKTTQNIKSLSDKVEPKLLDAYIIDNETIKLIFSETLDSISTSNISLFSLNGEDILSSKLSSNKTETYLKVNPLETNKIYQLDFEKIKDKSINGNPIKKTSIELIDKPIIGYWKFNEDYGNNVKDYSGNENNGFIKNLNSVEGKFGNAIHFKDNSFLKCEASTSLNLNGNMAISVWIKLDNPLANKYYRILSKREKWNSETGYEIEINPALKRINISGGARDAAQQGVVKYQFDKEWHHLVSIIKDNIAYAYIDNKLIGTDNLAVSPNFNNTPLFIGSNPQGSDCFEGYIDDLIIFNRALSNAEIIALSIANK